MKLAARVFIGLSALVTMASCGNPAEPIDPADRFLGRWVKVSTDLPPVTLEVRREANGITGIVGQVWLSGTTYTYPAFVTDTSITIVNLVSSSLAPFSGVLTLPGKMRATLRGGTSEVEVTLQKLSNID